MYNVFRILDNGKVEYGEFTSTQQYNKSVWLDINLVDRIEEVVEENTVYKLPTHVKKVDGRYVPDLVEIEKAEQLKLKAKNKRLKEEELNSLVINHNTVLYDAHGEALGNMATVIAIAGAIFNKAISVGINGTIMDLLDAYNYVYKNQTVTWKGADNKPHTVQIESLVEASEKAMNSKAEILFKY